MKRLSVAIKSLLVLTTAITLFSFKAGYGGDSFVIYLNNKAVLKQHVSANTSPQTIVLERSSPNDQLDIFYSECGQIGKKRTISLRDMDNKIVKQWQFADITKGDKNNHMSCNVKDIIAIQKLAAADKLNLYYSSADVHPGRLLARIVVADETKNTKP